MASTKFYTDIQAVHNDWCRENGYPVRWCKPQAVTSGKLQATSSKRQAPSNKRQAASRKRQAI